MTACKPETYDGFELQRIIDDFAEPFVKHLAEEVETLLQLSDLDEDKLKKLWKEAEAYALDCDKVRANGRSNPCLSMESVLLFLLLLLLLLPLFKASAPIATLRWLSLG